MYNLYYFYTLEIMQRY